MGSLEDRLTQLLRARNGHFLMESGHHCDLWLDLDLLFVRPARLEPFVQALAGRLSPHALEALCGPMTGGAFVAQAVASKLDLEFIFTERLEKPESGVEYRIPRALRPAVRGRKVGIVDDVVNAGSAVRATYGDLVSCGAEPVVVGSLLALGRSA